MVCIAILNWNGCDDTSACLESLLKGTYGDYFIIVGDNGSEDGSLDRLYAAFGNEETGMSGNKAIAASVRDRCGQKTRIHRTKLGEETYPEVHARDIILYDLKENNGFSKANNLMVRFGAHYRPDCFLLLNNDTVAEPDFLEKLVRFGALHPEYKVLTPLILYFRDRKTVWNGGGRIRRGFRKYHYKDQDISQVREQDFIPCSFITGCCMLFAPDVLTEDGRIFTEKFFYGEEDFELALRLKRQKTGMACVTGSVIYHKVGASVSRHPSETGPVYIHYLNRLIDVRDYMGRISYPFYKAILCATLAMYLHKAFRMPLTRIAGFIRTLLRDASSRDSVPKDYCLRIFRNGVPD